MNKEFIPYKQAVELKELGFDEPCLAFYDGKETNQVYYNSIRNGSGDYEPFKNNERLKWFGAPLYQQAFKWFREKHRLYHVINMFGDWDKPQYSYIVSGKTMGNPAHMWYYEDVDSYEKAELICLNKLIEIIKNKFGGLEK